MTTQDNTKQGAGELLNAALDIINALLHGRSVDWQGYWNWVMADTSRIAIVIVAGVVLAYIVARWVLWQLFMFVVDRFFPKKRKAPAPAEE